MEKYHERTMTSFAKVKRDAAADIDGSLEHGYVLATLSLQ